MKLGEKREIYIKKKIKIKKEWKQVSGQVYEELKLQAWFAKLKSTKKSGKKKI